MPVKLKPRLFALEKETSVVGLQAGPVEQNKKSLAPSVVSLEENAQSSKIRGKIAPHVGGTSRNPQSGEHKRRLNIVGSARPQAGAISGERLR